MCRWGPAKEGCVWRTLAVTVAVAVAVESDSTDPNGLHSSVQCGAAAKSRRPRLG